MPGSRFPARLFHVGMHWKRSDTFDFVNSEMEFISYPVIDIVLAFLVICLI